MKVELVLLGPSGGWNRYRWHVYDFQPGPQVVTSPLDVGRTVSDGDVIRWRGLQLAAVETPGPTEGSVSYILDVPTGRYCFCGDLIYGAGQLHDLYSLQKGAERVRDYHGFLGQRRKLLSSVERLVGFEADYWIPAHGPVIEDPKEAAALLRERLDRLWRNYVSISALNYYFPGFLTKDSGEYEVMPQAKTHELPPFVRRLGHTSFALISQAGEALLVDCGHQKVVETLEGWLKEGVVRKIDGCWVTHYHDDHVDALPRLAEDLGVAVLAEEHVAEVIEKPKAFLLPCISPNPVKVAQVVKDGQSWHWQEFRLTAYYLPGQSLYHGGLLVEGRGLKLFFAGDSGAPSGIDDYCPANRTFIGPGQVFSIEVVFTNHSPRAAAWGLAKPVVPGPEWQVRESEPVKIAPLGVGTQVIELTTPQAESRQPLAKAVVPFRVYWQGRYLGQVIHALVNIV